MTIFARPSEWTRTGVRRAGEASPQLRLPHYFAFLSYSHRDEQFAEWLHESLESFRVPRHLVGKLTGNGPIPRRLTPVFRDIGELPASDDLGSELRASIAGSRFLIVLCSPAAAASKWTNAEIAAFKRARPEGCILAAIVAGEPFASDMPGREAEECLPRALRFKFDRRGRPTARRAEPLAADFRGPADARRVGLLKLVAGMLGIGLDELIQREAHRRHQRMAAITGASVLGMVVAAGLAVTAIQARDSARDQRRQAESLVGFMLGDLKEKLEPIGKLDALDGVGARVLDYYQKAGTSELGDSALSQRSAALSLMAQVATLRGDMDGALRLYHEALAGTAEAVRRDPDDPRRLFDHAQNVFWVGEIARQRGETGRALESMREYKRLASRMVAIEPDNMQWRMEVQNADANLGIVLLDQRKFGEASRGFAEALATIRALATADPANADYQKSLAESLAWLADSRLAEGRPDAAIALRLQHVELLEHLLAASRGDVDFRQKLIQAHRALGNIRAARGDGQRAIGNFTAALDQADRLLAVEPDNSLWMEFAANTRLDLAQHLLRSGDRSGSEAQARIGCRLADALIARDPTVLPWMAARRDCLLVEGQLAARSGNSRRALALAGAALDSAQREAGGARAAHSYAIAMTGRIVGDIRRSAGDGAGAAAAWNAGLDRLPRNVAERPSEMSERARLLERLGRGAEARPIRARLRSMGFDVN